MGKTIIPGGGRALTDPAHTNSSTKKIDLHTGLVKSTKPDEASDVPVFYDSLEDMIVDQVANSPKPKKEAHTPSPEEARQKKVEQIKAKQQEHREQTIGQHKQIITAALTSKNPQRIIQAIREALQSSQSTIYQSSTSLQYSPAHTNFLQWLQAQNIDRNLGSIPELINYPTLIQNADVVNAVFNSKNPTAFLKKYLSSPGADPNAMRTFPGDRKGASLLTNAVIKKDTESFKLLIGTPGINISAPDGTGRTALFYSVRSDDAVSSAMTEELMSKKIDVRAGDSVLYAATDGGNFRAVRLLIARGADLNFLLNHNLGLDVKKYREGTAGQRASMHLVDAEKTFPGAIKLFDSIRNRAPDTTILDHYIAKGAPEILDEDGNNVLMMLAKISGQESHVQRLLSVNRELTKTKNSAKKTALELARIAENIPAANLLEATEAGATKLIKLLQNPESNPDSTLEAYIKLQRNLDVRDENGDSLIMIAARNGHLNAYKKLADAGANLYVRNNIPDRSYFTLITAAIDGRNTEIVRDVLARRAAARVLTPISDDEVRILNDGIIHAGAEGNIEMVKELLNQGASVNARNGAGSSPLLQAARTGNIAVARLLLDHGANLLDADNRGFTPETFAHYHNQNEAEKFFREEREARAKKAKLTIGAVLGTVAVAAVVKTLVENFLNKKREKEKLDESINEAFDGILDRINAVEDDDSFTITDHSVTPESFTVAKTEMDKDLEQAKAVAKEEIAKLKIIEPSQQKEFLNKKVQALVKSLYEKSDEYKARKAQEKLEEYQNKYFALFKQLEERSKNLLVSLQEAENLFKPLKKGAEDLVEFLSFFDLPTVQAAMNEEDKKFESIKKAKGFYKEHETLIAETQALIKSINDAKIFTALKRKLETERIRFEQHVEKGRTDIAEKQIKNLEAEIGKKFDEEAKKIKEKIEELHSLTAKIQKVPEENTGYKHHLEHSIDKGLQMQEEEKAMEQRRLEAERKAAARREQEEEKRENALLAAIEQLEAEIKQHQVSKETRLRKLSKEKDQLEWQHRQETKYGSTGVKSHTLASDITHKPASVETTKGNEEIAQLQEKLQELGNEVGAATRGSKEATRYAILKLAGQALEIMNHFPRNFGVRFVADPVDSRDIRNVIFHPRNLIHTAKPAEVIEMGKFIHSEISAIVADLTTRGGFVNDPLRTTKRLALPVNELFRQLIVGVGPQVTPDKNTILFLLKDLQTLDQGADKDSTTHKHARDMIGAAIGEAAARMRDAFDPNFNSLPTTIRNLINHRNEVAHADDEFPSLDANGKTMIEKMTPKIIGAMIRQIEKIGKAEDEDREEKEPGEQTEVKRGKSKTKRPDSAISKATAKKSLKEDPLFVQER